MLGDAWGRPGYGQRRGARLLPARRRLLLRRDPQRAMVVKVDVAGRRLDKIGIEVSGRQVVITGSGRCRRPRAASTSSSRSPPGPFRRIVELQVDVDAERARATYEDGVLLIELPLRENAETARRVPIERDRDG